MNKKMSIALAILLAFPGLSYSAGDGWPTLENSKSSEISQILKKAITYNFKDPDSSLFRLVKLSKDGYFSCGEVNAKNSYGAYSGYRKFLASPKAIWVESEPSSGVGTGEEYKRFCSTF